MRLLVTRKQRLRFRNVAPLRKALTPPGVIFGNRMVLREVEGDEPDIGRHVGGLGEVLLGRPRGKRRRGFSTCYKANVTVARPGVGHRILTWIRVRRIWRSCPREWRFETGMWEVEEDAHIAPPCGEPIATV